MYIVNEYLSLSFLSLSLHFHVDRRKKYVRDSESRYWEHMTPACMTEESDSENAEKIVTHQLLWRSECKFNVVWGSVEREEGKGSKGKREEERDLIFSLSSVMNQFIQKLDSRYDKARKPGTGSTVKRERIDGLPSTSHPPPNLPSWMIDPAYKMPTSTSVCMSPPTLEPQEPPTGK